MAMSEDEMVQEALKQVLSGMDAHARNMKMSKYGKKPVKALEVDKVTVGKPDEEKMEVSPTESSVTLDGLMHKKGNSGADMAKEGELSPDELDAILSGAK